MNCTRSLELVGAPPTLIMLYSPRDASELEIVWRPIQASYAFARGD